jgi:Carboxypeptidase regulatory-like domain
VSVHGADLQVRVKEVSDMRQNKIVALAIATAVAVQALPVVAASPGAAGQSLGTASLAGTSKDEAGSIVPHVKVQLRDLSTGKLVATTTSDQIGQFSFGGLGAGNYAIELVSSTGEFMGTSASIAVAAGATLTGVTVTAATQAALIAAAAAGGTSTALIVVAVAAAAGIAALVVVNHYASGSL